MSYYDHATEMAYKLKPWDEDRVLKNYELEKLASEQRMSHKRVESDKRSSYQRYPIKLVALFRWIKNKIANPH